ncbi:MAG: hypothetical protein AB7U97_24405, partial [Pirellulales bacterium]
PDFFRSAYSQAGRRPVPDDLAARPRARQSKRELPFAGTADRAEPTTVEDRPAVWKSLNHR